MGKRKGKVLVAMSGGVDSSVAAYLLREAGYEVSGVFLRLDGTDAADAHRVARRLGISLLVTDARRDFARIIDYFVAEYARGRTPNPCVRCNAFVKFASLIARADAAGAEYVATGHHARMMNGQIHRGGEKDQSYALFGVARERLGRILLPIGEVAGLPGRQGGKARIRRIAGRLGLHVADKPDSQEICFVSGNYVDLLRRRRPEAFRPGEIVDSSGGVLGRHDGVGRFTVGQRRGLGVAAGVPMYVTRIDTETATVTIGPKEELISTYLSAGGANWHIDPPAPGSQFDATVQIRYNHQGARGRVRVTGADSFEVVFSRPVLAVTPGQAAVIYEADALLGGGWIENANSHE